MRKPSNTEAWIGAGGAVAGALVAGIIALVPWAWSSPDPTISMRNEIAAGLKGLEEIAEPAHQLRQIAKLEDLLELDRAIHFQRVLSRHRQRLKKQIELREAADLAIAREEELEKQRLADLKAARTAAADQAEKDRLEKEAVEAAAAAEAAKAERLRREAEAKRANEEAARLAEEQRKKEEIERQRRNVELQRQLQDERQCLNRNCTSWILR